MQIGKYMGKILHSGQPEFQNRNPDERVKTCHKGLKPGHLIYECPNDWVCRKCEQSVHKIMDCPQDFHDNEADDSVHNGDKSTEIHPLVEITEATTNLNQKHCHLCITHLMGTTNNMLIGQVPRKLLK